MTVLIIHDSYFQILSCELVDSNIQNTAASIADALLFREHIPNWVE